MRKSSIALIILAVFGVAFTGFMAIDSMAYHHGQNAQLRKVIEEQNAMIDNLYKQIEILRGTVAAR